MAQKFTSSISEKSREQIIAEIKAGKVSNFFKSSCPWTDGQELTFDKLVLVDWDNGSQSGSYLAIKFKDNDNPFALSMPLKKVFAHKTADEAKKKENAQEFKSEKGLCEILQKHSSLSEDMMKAVEDFCKVARKIKLVQYFELDRFDRPVQHYLVNLI